MRLCFDVQPATAIPLPTDQQLKSCQRGFYAFGTSAGKALCVTFTDDNNQQGIEFGADADIHQGY